MHKTSQVGRAVRLHALTPGVLYVVEDLVDVAACCGHMQDVGNGTVDRQEPGRRGVDCAALGETDGGRGGEHAPRDHGIKKGADLVGVRVGVWNRLEEDVKVAKQVADIVGQGQGLSMSVPSIRWPIPSSSVLRIARAACFDGS